MQLIRLKKRVAGNIDIYGDPVHIDVFYFRGKGFVDSSEEFRDDPIEIAEIERFLKGESDLCSDDRYLRVVGKTELSDQEFQEFLAVEKQYLTAKEQRQQKLKSLIDKVPND